MVKFAIIIGCICIISAIITYIQSTQIDTRNINMSIESDREKLADKSSYVVGSVITLICGVICICAGLMG